MAKEDILKRIAALEDAIWYQEMGDFIDWAKYNKMKEELKQLKKILSDLDD